MYSMHVFSRRKGGGIHMVRPEENVRVFLHCFLSHSTAIGPLTRHESRCFPPWICLSLPPALGFLTHMTMPRFYKCIGDSDSSPHDLGGSRGYAIVYQAIF